jgi:alginate biosynthesis protein AlgX
MTRKIIPFLLAALLAALALPGAAEAKPSANAMAFAYQQYLKQHPPKEKIVKYNVYPYGGSVIPNGENIPLWAAAQDPASYERKTAVKYILHGKDGWLFRTADFRTDFTAQPKTLDYFRRLNRALEARGQTLLIAFQPPRALMSASHLDRAAAPKGYTTEKARDGYNAFLEQLDDQGLKTVDLSEADIKAPYFAKGDFHWTPGGATDAAQKVASALRKLSVYDDIPRQNFQSEITGLDVATRGAFEEFIQQTCHINIELTSNPLWTTHAVGKTASTAASLLGDAAVPSITVIGTSNSAEDNKFNFVGALKKFVHADIYNAALTGGGFGESAARYYASDEYHDHPPKAIIWEFLSQHNYNNAESLAAFRQMIPAVYGTCSKEKSLAAFDGPISGTQTELFSKVDNISLKDSYLYMDVKDPVERNLRVDILYDSGNADQVELTRSTRIHNNGRYFLELSDPANSHALHIQLVTDKPQGHVAARICPYPVQVAEK